MIHSLKKTTIVHLFIPAVLLMTSLPASIHSGEFLKRSHRHGEATLPYQLFVPEGYTTAKSYPIVLVLHGAGERGDDTTRHMVNNVTEWCGTIQQSVPAFIVFPQCPHGNQWVDVPWSSGLYNSDTVAISNELATSLSLVDSLMDEFSIDENRQYITGLSMGGFGVWDALIRFPDRFAAAMPVCGGSDPTKAKSISHVPVWAFHGAHDGAINPQGTRQMIQGIRDAGVDVLLTECPDDDCSKRLSGEQLAGEAEKYQCLYTEYPTTGHNAWEQAYQNTVALAWILSHVRNTETHSQYSFANSYAKHEDGNVPAISLRNPLQVDNKPPTNHSTLFDCGGRKVSTPNSWHLTIPPKSGTQ